MAQLVVGEYFVNINNCGIYPFFLSKINERILIFACHIKIGPTVLRMPTDEFVFVDFCGDGRWIYSPEFFFFELKMSYF